MSAHYDSYNYPSYWKGREYEHKAEEIALGDLLNKINNIDRVLDIGAGYGRLVPTYLHRAKRIYLTDPSSKLLKLARDAYKEKKIKFIHSKLETLKGKVKGKSIDLVIFIRVLHHIKDPQKAFKTINKFLEDGGYLILEFPNKRHLKALTSEFIKGNFTFMLDIFSKDIRSPKSIRKKTLPFKNYHPDKIKLWLSNSGFEIIEVLSVSNIRSPFIKGLFPAEVLLSIERLSQQILGKISFGPSIFILARKKD
jgi:ubiquinone/menaquinone biosynthesis C-methylase UbiE